MNLNGDGPKPPAEPPEGRLLWRFGEVVLDEAQMRLVLGGSPITLEPKPMELLMFLLRHVGEVVTREEIIEALWPDRMVVDGVLNNCVAKLRSALQDHDKQQLLTVPRYGYRLAVEVECEPCATPRPPQSLRLAPGGQVAQRPHWRLQEQLSAGPHGEVWLARRQQTREQRVIKFCSDPEGLAGLKREITLHRVLRDTLGDTEDFARIIDWNLEIQPHFLEIAYHPLGNLADWCARQGGASAVPLETRLELVAQCAAAVASAHSAGVLHKDLKPSNVLIGEDPDGTPRISLCDFAAGRILSPAVLERLNITRLGFTQTVSSFEMAGTPRYMAPEVIAGQPPTTQSDIYALGVMLFQLVVGDLTQMMSAGWERHVEDPLLREDIALAAAGDPHRRLSNAGQLSIRLRSLELRRAERQQQQHNLKTVAEARRAQDRHNARRGLMVALAVTVVVALSANIWMWVDGYTAPWRETLPPAPPAMSTVPPYRPAVYGRTDAALAHQLDIVRAAITSNLADRPVIRAPMLAILGGAYAAIGQHQTAETLLTEAESLQDSYLGRHHPDTQATRLVLRDSAWQSGALPALASVGQRIVDTEADAGRTGSSWWYEGEWSLRYANLMSTGPATVGAACGDTLLALAHQARDSLGARHPTPGRLLGLAGHCELAAGNFARAEPLLRQATQMLESTSGDHDPTHFRVMLDWLTSLQAEARQDESAALLRQLQARLARYPGLGSELSMRTRQAEAQQRLAAGDAESAYALLDEVLEWHLGVYGERHPSTRQVISALHDVHAPRPSTATLAQAVTDEAATAAAH